LPQVAADKDLILFGKQALEGEDKTGFDEQAFLKHKL